MSSLLEPDSPFAASASAESTTTGQSHSTKWRSNVWAHCRRPTKDENASFLYCSHCLPDSRKSPYGTAIAQNMKKHLKSRHQITVEKALSKNQVAVNKQMRQLYQQAGANNEREEFDAEILEASLDMTVFIEALITLIVVRDLPFTLVEWPEFHTLCQVLNRASEGKITISHSVVANKVKEAWEKHKDTIRQSLQAALSHIHISLDIWTSPNRWPLLAICAHFTTYESKKQQALLALPKVPGRSGEDQLSVLYPVLEDYGIVQKLGAITADNATTNNVLCRLVQKRLKDMLGLNWEAEHWRISCIGHIINLIVQAFLFTGVVELEELESYDEQDGIGIFGDYEATRTHFRLMGPLGQAHNIVVHIRGSAGRTEEFRELAGRIIPMDNRTRWNSWFNMLVVLLNLRPAVEKYCQDHEEELEDDILTPKDWKKLCTIKDFLVPFSRATLFTEGDSTSLDSTVFTMDILIKYLQEKTAEYKKKKDKESKDFLRRLEIAHAVLDDYYLKADMSPIYAAALVLNPSYRTRHIETHWPKKWSRPILVKVQKLWEKYREEVMVPLTPSPFSYDNPSRELPELDLFDQIALSLSVVARPATEDEYEDYNSIESFDPGNEGALAWWCEDMQRQRWPRLSLMAIDILSIPPMSDEPERVFSGARRTISWDGGQMEPETIEMRECLKHWKKSRILDTFFETSD